MNKRPSERVNALIDTIKHQPVSYGEIVSHLEIMRDQFQKEEAEAYRGLQAVNEYYGVEVINKLIEKSNKLTGR